MDAQTNDQLRHRLPFLPMPDLFVRTRGIATKEADDQIVIIEKVKNFNEFSKGNDPYGEHDFGAFDYKGEKIFWKIDDYSRGSKDDNPEGYRLILTILLAEEY